MKADSSSHHLVPQPLPEVVDQSILKCPIDTRRRLYNNIVLSGGSTMFKVGTLYYATIERCKKMTSLKKEAARNIFIYKYKYREKNEKRIVDSFK